MYENCTFEFLLDRMTQRAKAIDNEMDIGEGSLIYSILAVEAWELAEAYINISAVYDNTFADTAPREELILRARERGLEPKQATHAILRGKFNINIPIYSRFSLDDLNYTAIDKIGERIYKMKCETIGTEGNKKLGEIIPIGFIEGLETAELTELLIPAIDEEDTEEFRNRYFDSFNLQSFGGNRADYIKKIKNIDGVGACKCSRATADNPNVTIVILNNQYGAPSSTLVDLVQNTIDPRGTQGNGDGLAPICHIVDVFGAIETNIDISFGITLDIGYVYDDIKEKIEKAIDNYFLELSKSWEETENLIVRIARLESTILNITGVLDIENTTINKDKRNLTLLSNSIPIRGNVSANN